MVLSFPIKFKEEMKRGVSRTAAVRLTSTGVSDAEIRESNKNFYAVSDSP